ncbi:response regulator [Patescibacteria group bacterium]|nr:response regulator [Patescibacteria group bacterium]
MHRPHSILLIEDDHLLGRLYSHLLQESGYQVRWVTSARTALKALAGEDTDLILLDVMLPEMSGVEFIERIPGRASQTVMLTNLDHARLKEELRSKGILGYIIKSDHTPDSFLGAIAEMIAKTDGQLVRPNRQSSVSL